MKKIINTFLFLLIILNIIVSGWFVYNKDVVFHTDIARDFLMLEEMKQKGIILLGPRSSLPGMFHGPLWTYLNYPVYLLTQGNPIAHGIFWIILGILFLISTYFIVKKIFNSRIALYTVLLLSYPIIDITKGMYHPYGALMLMPVFFYFFLKYIKEGGLKYLIITLFLTGLAIQFQVAAGPTLLLLASIPILIKIIKSKTYSHLWAFLILLIPLSTFFLFDLRHNFIQVKSVIGYFLRSGKVDPYPFDQMFQERLKNLLINGLYLAHGQYEWFNIIMSYFIALTSLLVFQQKKSRFRTEYLFLLYFYCGFWIASFIHPGFIMFHMFIAFIFFPMIIFAATSLFVNKKIFGLFLSLLIFANLIWIKRDIKNSYNFFSLNQESWKGQYEIAKKVFEDAKVEEFGYFIFAPDIVAYSPKYAMIYGQKVFNKTKAYPFQKKSLTYLVIAPPPKDKPYLNEIFWKSDQIKIKNSPKKVFNFPNGYRVEKIRLSDKEILIAPQKYLNVFLENR